MRPPSWTIEAARWSYLNPVDAFALLRAGRVERINPAWTEMTGWTAASMNGVVSQSLQPAALVTRIAAALGVLDEDCEAA